MAERTEEARTMDAFDLQRVLSNFVTCNLHHHTPEYRWLAQQAIPLKNIAYDLHANGIASFREKNAGEIAAMRLAEIEEEREKLAKSDQRLADEAKKLQQVGVYQ